ncbi:MAG: zinc-binding alcohol dehydrogenase [Bacteroidia bacterium]|nr:zinc-binding alcohol dehydrogenase [Bacteroidia bacterium]
MAKTDQGRGLWHISPGISALRPATKPAGTWLQVEALHSLISLGTEGLVAAGQVPESLHEAMAVPYQEGSLALPVKYGYSLVGKVAQAGHALHGQTVHLLHPHQDRLWVAESDCFVVPQAVPARRATLASNLETAVNALWDAGVAIGDRVVVVGFGLIGALVADLLGRMPGVQVSIHEQRSDRVALAQAWGYQLWSDTGAACDLAFHASASAEGLQAAIHAVGQEGKVVDLSWYGERTITVALGGSFHAQRKQIIASQVSTIPPHQAPRWDYRRRKQLVFDLLHDPQFDRYLTHQVPFEQLPEFFHQLRQSPPAGLAWTVAFGEGVGIEV